MAEPVNPSNLDGVRFGVNRADLTWLNPVSDFDEVILKRRDDTYPVLPEGEAVTSISALIHSDTINGSTTFVDSSASEHAISVTGNIQHSTAKSKMGSSSIYIPDAGDYITVSGGEDFNFGTGDFTIDYHQNQGDYNSFYLFTIGAEGHTYSSATFTIITYSTKIKVKTRWNNLTDSAAYDFDRTFVADVWNHIAVVRENGMLMLFLDGVAIGEPQACTEEIIASELTIGITYPTSTLPAYIDEVRVVKGEAEWTENFTPPTTPYTAFIPDGDLVYQGPEEAFSDTSLSSNIPYYYTIFASNLAGDWSTGINFLMGIDINAPNFPSSPVAYNVNGIFSAITKIDKPTSPDFDHFIVRSAINDGAYKYYINNSNVAEWATSGTNLKFGDAYNIIYDIVLADLSDGDEVVFEVSAVDDSGNWTDWLPSEAITVTAEQATSSLTRIGCLLGINILGYCPS